VKFRTPFFRPYRTFYKTFVIYYTAKSWHIYQFLCLIGKGLEKMNKDQIAQC